MHKMAKENAIPQLPEDQIKPSIVTGLEALGRGHDLDKMEQFLKHLEPLGPEMLQMYMNIGDYIKRVGTSLGMDLSGLVKSEQQVQQEQQQKQMQQMVDQLGPQAVQQMGGMAQKAMDQNQGQGANNG